MAEANPKSEIRNPKSGLPLPANANAEVKPAESALQGGRDISNPKSKIPNPKSGGVVVPHKAKWHQRLVAVLIYAFIQCLSATIRFKLNDQSGFFARAPKEKFIFAIWHNRLSLCLVLYRRYVARPAPEHRMAAMVSASKDGGLLARILELFGVEPVRGSSSRRGPQALRELIAWGERGYDLAITPDGPRGPRYHVQEGVISTAQITGLVIVPVAYHLNWKFQIKSWDRFQVPLPFAVCEITVGHPMRVPREATSPERETLRLQLESALRSITRD